MPAFTHKTEAYIAVPFVLKDIEQWARWKEKIRNRLFGPWRLREGWWSDDYKVQYDGQPDPIEYPCLAVPLCHGTKTGAILEFEFIYKDVIAELFETEERP
jgi:hypothetical protein